MRRGVRGILRGIGLWGRGRDGIARRRRRIALDTSSIFGVIRKRGFWGIGWILGGSILFC